MRDELDLHPKAILYKPFRLDQLLETVETILDVHANVPPSPCSGGQSGPPGCRLVRWAAFFVAMFALYCYFLAVATLCGHVALWTWLYNRLHASSLPSPWVQKLEKLVILAMCGSLLALAGWVLRYGEPWVNGEWGIWPETSYTAVC